MEKRVVLSGQAPRPIGPYSQAIECGEFIFISGQVPVDPKTNELPPGGVAAQAAQCLENIKGILGQMGLDLTAVVKMTVFLIDMTAFAEMNKVYAGYFPAEPPARSCVAVKGLPLEAQVEMEAVAVKVR